MIIINSEQKIQEEAEACRIRANLNVNLNITKFAFIISLFLIYCDSQEVFSI